MSYVDKGSIAVDVEQGDLTSEIVITGEADVDLTTPGDYPVVHTVTDEDGAEASITRTVRVLDEDEFEFDIVITTTGLIKFSPMNSENAGLPIYVSVDGGLTFTQYAYNAYMPIMTDGIVRIKDPASISGSYMERITKMHVNKAYSLTTITMFKFLSTLVEFTVAHPNVFLNVLSFHRFMYYSNITYMPELNYNNATDTSHMFQYCGYLKCIAGEVNMDSSVKRSGFGSGSNALTAPNAASITDIENGTSWTNPGVCDATTQDDEV